MKAIISLFSACLFSIATFGQGVHHISYSIAVTGSGPNAATIQSMLAGSKMDVYSKGDLTRANIAMGSMTTNTTIVDVKAGKALTLMSGMMGKIALKTSLDSFQAEKLKKNNVQITLVDGSKTIAGYPCKKAVLTTATGQKTILWYTDKVNLGSGMKYTEVYHKGVPGTPLEFSSTRGPVTMTFTASKIDNNATVASDFFNMTVPSGYKIMTMAQLKTMTGR